MTLISGTGWRVHPYYTANVPGGVGLILGDLICTLCCHFPHPISHYAIIHVKINNDNGGQLPKAKNGPRSARLLSLFGAIASTNIRHLFEQKCGEIYDVCESKKIKVETVEFSNDV